MPAPEQITVDPQLTLALAQASVAAYADYERKPVVPPPNYRMVARWTGWDDILFDFGYVERFGVLFQCTIPGQTQTFIFAFRGTDSDMDTLKTCGSRPQHSRRTRASFSPTPYVSGFYGIYTALAAAHDEIHAAAGVLAAGALPAPDRIHYRPQPGRSALATLYPRYGGEHAQAVGQEHELCQPHGRHRQLEDRV